MIIPEDKTSPASRRDFVKKATVAFGSIAAFGTPLHALAEEQALVEGKNITITPSPQEHEFKPLETVTVAGGAKGVLVVRDGLGQEYFRHLEKGTAPFQVAEALGSHLVIVESRKGEILKMASFQVNFKRLNPGKLRVKI